jgi:hypothetical protein
MYVICHYYCCLTLNFSATTESSVLDGSKTYLLENAFLTSIGLHFHTIYKVMICITCQAAKIPGDIKGHLKKQHSLVLSKTQSSELESLFEHLGVKRGFDVVHPAPNGPPVEGLTVIEDGFCCANCLYCTPERRSLQSHWSRAHKGDPTFSNGQYTRGSIQTFFNPLPIRYFHVNPNLASVSADDPYTIFARDEKPTYQALPGNPPSAPREVPPLLKATEWHVHLDAYCRNTALRQSLKTLTKLPGRQTALGIDSLGAVACAYMDSIRALANKVPFGVRCLLMQCPRYVNFTSQSFIAFITFYRLSAHDPAWVPLADDASLRNYSFPLTCLVRSVLLTLDPHPSHYQYKLTPNDINNGQHLIHILNSNQPLSAKIDAFHLFVYPFLSAPELTGTYSKWNDVLECFLAIYHIRDDGNFNTVHDVTQIFAKFKYHCRGATLFEAMKNIDAYGSNPLKYFILFPLFVECS